MADVTAGQQLVIDQAEDDDDRDSGLGSDSASDTTTLASWISDYREENGRTYHAFRDGAYFQPNDALAQEHLDLAHHLFLRTFENRLFPCPRIALHESRPRRRHWHRYLGNRHGRPTSASRGLRHGLVAHPAVVGSAKLLVRDQRRRLRRLEFPEQSLRFYPRPLTVRLHQLLANLYAECLQILKPGGWIEQLEFSAGFTSDDGSVTDETAMAGWIKPGIRCFELMGKDIMVFQKMRDLIPAAGFEAAEEKIYKWPIGTWPKDKRMKEIGFWTRAHLDMGLEGWAMRGLTSMLGWSREEVLAFCANMRKDLRDPKLHGIHEMRVVFARKPLQGTETSVPAG